MRVRVMRVRVRVRAGRGGLTAAAIEDGLVADDERDQEQEDELNRLGVLCHVYVCMMYLLEVVCSEKKKQKNKENQSVSQKHFINTEIVLTVRMVWMKVRAISVFMASLS